MLQVQDLKDGFKVFHNFIRQNAKDKITPAEKCGIGINGNRWETMLLNSIKQTQIKQEVPIATGEQILRISP